jgi:hypothetical protein
MIRFGALLDYPSDFRRKLRNPCSESVFDRKKELALAPSAVGDCLMDRPFSDGEAGSRGVRLAD